MSRQYSNEEILSAIRESGYLLEQQIATRLEAMDFGVITNRAFEDPIEGKSREMDIWAFKKYNKESGIGVPIFVELICECKNTSYPLVFLERQKNQVDLNPSPKEFSFPIMVYNEIIKKEGNIIHQRSRDPLDYLGLQSKHHYYKLDKKITQFCRIGMNKKTPEASHGGLFEQLFLPIGAAFEAMRRENKPHDEEIWLTSLIVVTASPLFILDTKTEELREVNFASVRRELRSRHLKGLYLLDFVQANHFENFIQDEIVRFTQAVEQVVISNPEKFERGYRP